MLTQTLQSNTKRIPKLRFSGFSDEWEEKKLGKVSRFFSGGTPSSTNKKYYSGIIPFIKSGEISNIKTEQFISEEALKNSSAKIVEKGDLLYALYGATSGAVAISQIQGAINQAVLCIRTDENRDWLFHYFLYKKERILAKYLQGGQGNLSADIIKKIDIIFPSKEEQEKIASFLGSVNGWIDNFKSQKENLESYKKEIIKKIFSHEVNFKDDKGKDFPKWEKKMLGNMLSMVIDNRGKTPPIEKAGIPLLEVNSLGKRFVDYLKVSKYVSEKTYKNWFRKYLQPNDILFSTVGATALCSFYKGDQQAVVAQNIVGLRFKNEDPSFMYYLLTEKNNNHKFKRIEMGAVQPSVKVSQMIKIIFLLPSILEQQRIAEFLTYLDKVIELKNNQIIQAEQWKKGLMQGLFI